MRRVMYLWLPRWPIDRLRLSPRKNSAAPAEATPFATVIDTAGRRLLAAINPAAAAAGLAAGMPLADALSFVPGLATALAEPAEDAAALQRLAEWCGRYSPWTAPDEADGVRVEITGSAHLWGGEAALTADLMSRLDRQGIASRIAIADTLGAAWALARFAQTGERIVIQPPGDARDGLAGLPVEALRLDPATVQGLRRVGLKQVGDLYAMPRPALVRRFGEAVARRLDLAFHRIDGQVERIVLGTARPSRDPHHLAALLKERLDTVDPGIGVEDMILAAFAVEPLPPEQIGFAGSPGTGTMAGTAPLLDRLGNRLGLDALYRLEPYESHIPERASVHIAFPLPSRAGGEGRVRGAVSRRDPGPRSPAALASAKPPRPIRLFEPPEPVEAFWLLPDDPPFRFTWRRRPHRVMRADGPERIAEEWWWSEGSGAVDAIRDYYRVEDEEGRRFWLFRAGLHGHDHPPRWFVHGVFS